jgi:hypothetical protein
LGSYEAVGQLIGSTTTRSGLKVQATLAQRECKSGRNVAARALQALQVMQVTDVAAAMLYAAFHPLPRWDAL